MEQNLKVNENEYLPLRDVVFNTLRQAILRGEFKPGERLMEIQLANKLGVSRTPIREAIRKLELEGLVIMIPRKGAEVADITEKSLRDVEELEKAGENFKKVLNRSKDITEVAEADVRFHDVIYMATDNQKLIHLLNKLREQMYRYRVEYLKNPDVHEQLIQEHEEIVYHIKRREKAEATAVTCQHIDNQVSAVTDKIRTKNN